jgi:hypothetical protein
MRQTPTRQNPKNTTLIFQVSVIMLICVVVLNMSVPDGKVHHPVLDDSPALRITPANKVRTEPVKNASTDAERGNPYSKHYQPNATIWSRYLRETEAEDKELVNLWQTGLDQLLIFVR